MNMSFAEVEFLYIHGVRSMSKRVREDYDVNDYGEGSHKRQATD